MTPDAHLAGIDPYDAFDREAERIDEYLSRLPADAAEWHRPSRCVGWTVRDVLAHLLATERYHEACLDGTTPELLADMAARGVVDVEQFNAVGIADLDGVGGEDLLDRWRARNAATRRGYRERDGGDVATLVGDYPARWQAFHLVGELATHADDMGVPEDDQSERMAWRMPFSRFALSELKPDLLVEASSPGHTRVRGADVDLDLADTTFVAAVAGRSDDPSLGVLSTSP